jgi:AcrR family transcriptional regulator
MARRTKEDAARTRQAILDAARLEFASRGYAATSIADIADRTMVTHGALYHHFTNKDALFRAVFDEVTDTLNRRVVEAAIEGVGARDQFARGCRALLEHMADREYQRIALADAPSVLGMDQWWAVDGAVGMRTTVAGLKSLQGEGLLPEGSVESLGVLLYGGLTEAGMELARPEATVDIDGAIDTVMAVLDAIGRLDRLP